MRPSLRLAVVLAATASTTLAAQLQGQSSAPAADVTKAVTGGETKCVNGLAKGFGCQNVDLISFLPAAALGAKDPLMLGELAVIFNGIWGWVDSTTKREFVIICRVDGAAFVEVTDPANPKYLGELPLHEGANPSYWRDVKVYKNHAFIIADAAGDHGMQVFDLTQLRDVKNAPVTFKETAHYANLGSAHTLALNEATGFAYAVSVSSSGETCGGNLHMIDLREPTKPKFAGCFDDPAGGGTHETSCFSYHGPDQKYKGRELCLDANGSELSIADVTDKANPKHISNIAYPNVSYAHQAWFTEDHRYVYLNDETDDGVGGVDKTRTIIFDLQKLDEPVVLKEFYGTTAATDHNLYIRGPYVFESNYKAGMRVLDATDPNNTKEVGYFDTYPDNDNAGYAGSWTNYPYFKSANDGVVAVSSISEGLFMVRFRPPAR